MTAKKLISTAALAMLLMAGAASAQTSTTSTSTDVGTPNTGFGGTATENALILATTGIIAAAGIAFLARRRAL